MWFIVACAANLHNAAHAFSSPSRCFQLSRQIFISYYYMDTGVLLKNIPLVKFIKNTSGTRVVYFP